MEGPPAFSLRKRIRWAVMIAVLALLLLAAALYKVANARCFALVGDLTCRVETSRPMVALTFDDGPTPGGVDHALAALAGFDAKATFFLIGRDLEWHPDAARRLHAAGHELANHSYSHRRMIGRSSTFYDTEIARTDTLLREAGAANPDLFRPPYGKKLIGLPLALKRRGYRMVMIDVEEPLGDDPRVYADRIIRDARPGSIILMHIMYPANGVARRALPLVLEGLRAHGFQIVPVGELIRAGTPATLRTSRNEG